MKFCMPVRVYEEENCVAKHAAELAALGKKALIVTGRHSAARCGALADVQAALAGEGRDFCCFSQVEENPSVETVMAGCAFGLREGADFVVGIGGGSPMDAAKAVAFLMKLDRPEPAALYDSRLPGAHLPVAAVPTTCGTGSEVTGVSVLTVHERQTKQSIPFRIFPALALLDGKYLATAGERVVISTALDALGHLMESYLSARADEFSRAIALEGLRLWGRCIRHPDLHGEMGPALRSDLLRASCYAGMAIAQTGCSLPHALSYIPTYDLGTPHGIAVGRFLPGFVAEAPEALTERMLEAAGFSGAADLLRLIRRCLPEAGEIPQESCRKAWEKISANEAKMRSCCFPVDRESLLRMTAEWTDR